MKRLENKVALITGSGRGIGRALALKLAGEGARVVVNDLDEAPASAVVGEIKANGGAAIAVPGSVTEPDFGERFVEAAMATFGGVDIIVSNAGYTIDSVIQKMTDENFDKMIDDANSLSGTDRAKAEQMFKDAQRKIIEDAAAVFILDRPNIHIIRSDIKGYVDNPAYGHVTFVYELGR